MTLKFPNFATIVAGLGGAAGITGLVCLFIGTTPSSTIGQAVLGAVSTGLMWITSHHAHKIVVARAVGTAAPKTV
jgi:hypothetical protein